MTILDGSVREVLNGRAVLVVEDSYLLAEELRCELRDAGAVVVGPAATPGRALRLATQEPVDVAILDVRLGSMDVAPVAELLERQGRPFLFLTGYADAAPLARWSKAPRLGKPVDHAALWSTLARLLTGRPDEGERRD